jgi:hypothetical protein
MSHRFCINKIQCSLSAASVQPGLVNAEQVLGLLRSELLHRCRKLVHLDCLAPRSKPRALAPFLVPTVLVWRALQST